MAFKRAFMILVLLVGMVGFLSLSRTTFVNAGTADCTAPQSCSRPLAIGTVMPTPYPPGVTCQPPPGGPYPGEKLFVFQCVTGGIAVTFNGAQVVRANFAQIAGPLLTAVSSAQNQRVTAPGTGVSLWALKSNELQVHFDSNPDCTKLVVKADICGSVVSQAAASFISQPAVVYGPVTTTTPSTTTGRFIHIVQPGENLYRISLRYNRTIQAIAAANGITNYNLIYAGQRLVIP